jgi:hypothetical protein
MVGFRNPRSFPGVGTAAAGPIVPRSIQEFQRDLSKRIDSFVRRFAGESLSPLAWTNLCPALLTADIGLSEVCMELSGILLMELLRDQPQQALLDELVSIGVSCTNGWLSTPRSGTRPVVFQLACVANMVGILALRQRCLGGARTRRKAYRALKGFPNSAAWAMSRRGATASQEEASVLCALVAQQMRALLGCPGEPDLEAIYLLDLNGNTYGGRTHTLHKHQSLCQVGGLCTRWEQHSHQLFLHWSGKIAPKSKRTRYRKLLLGAEHLFSTIVVARIVPTDVAQTFESLLISECHTTANNLLRTPAVVAAHKSHGSTRGSGPRSRQHFSQRMRQLRLTHQACEPAEDRLFFCKLQRIFRAVGSDFKRKSHEMRIRVVLNTPFKTLYAGPQTDVVGPVNLHAMCLSVCMRRAAEKAGSVNWGAFFSAHGCKIDFCFCIYDFSKLIVKQAERARAQASILEYAHGFGVLWANHYV